MQNWVDTTIEATPAVVSVINRRFASEADYGDCLDFNKVIPIPSDVLMGTIPFWVPKVQAPTSEAQKTAVRTISLLYGLAQDDSAIGASRALFQAILEIAAQHDFDLSALGFPVRTWADWCPENWGTKWNALNCFFGVDHISFRTESECPHPVLEEISRLLGSGAVMKVSYSEEAATYKCGRYILHNGDIHNMTEMLYSTYDNDESY